MYKYCIPDTSCCSVVLPVEALLAQYKSAESSVVRQLDIAFIEHSIFRIEDFQRAKYVPEILKGISRDGASPTGPLIFGILLALLQEYQIPPRGTSQDDIWRDKMGLSDKQDALFVVQWLSKVLLLKLPSASSPSMELLLRQNPSLNQPDLEFLRVDSADGRKVYGRISALKAKIIAFIASAAFLDDEKFMPALYATASPDSITSSIGEDILKRLNVSLEDEDRVNQLFDSHDSMPASYRIRILGMLSKSALATRMNSRISRVVELDFSAYPSNEGLTSASRSLEPTSSLERIKLQKTLFQFLTWVSRTSGGASLKKVGPQLIEKMQGYVNQQGWPVSSQTSSEDKRLRSAAYDIIGALLARNSMVDYAQLLAASVWLFRSLSEDPTTEAVVSIDGALSALIPSVSHFTAPQKNVLLTLLLTYMVLPDEAPAVRSARHAAVKWTNRCLPYSNPKARWIDIIAIRGKLDERNEVVEEGKKGIDPWSHFAHNDTKPRLPDWTELVTVFFDSQVRINSNHSNAAAMQVDQTSAFQNFTGDAVAAFPVALDYCRQMLFLSALDDFDIGPNWESVLEARIRNDNKARLRIRSFLRTIDDSCIAFFLGACLDGLVHDSWDIAEECLSCLVSIAMHSPHSAIAYVAERAFDLIPFFKSSNTRIQSLSSQAFGILAAHHGNSNELLEKKSRDLFALAITRSYVTGFEAAAAEGSLLALSHLWSRMVYYGRGSEVDTLSRSLQYEPKMFEGSLELDSCCQFWTAGIHCQMGTPGESRNSLVKHLVALAKKGNEKAITALGRLGLAITDQSDQTSNTSTHTVDYILGHLFGLFELRQVEAHFTVGEAITAMVACWDSHAVTLSLDVDTEATHFRKKQRPTRIKALIEKLFHDCKTTKPSLLRASGIWLFCLVQYCSHLEDVRSRLRETQVAFMRLLVARDELIQETASRGLSLVYERGDTELRQDLVRDLVAAFTGSSTQLKVEDDTELFDSGVLTTGDGLSVTSYKDIVSLANEVGDQSLVYRFMSLASNAATWTTRSAFGRFGLSSILSEADVDPKLYPKLFRYRFDPNPNVQRSMNDIWRAIVKDPGTMVDRHFNMIMDDLLRSMLGMDWRVRQASCAAISYLVQGRPFEQYEKFYKNIWRHTVKVVDDIKSSVREAAFRLCMDLSNMLVRRLEESGSSAGTKAMMREALSFLLSQHGIESTVEDVRLLTTVSVLKIAKSGGPALKPFVPTMIAQFLGLLSTIEPDQINYGYQRAGEQEREVIDSLRSAMVRQSPISEGIDNCLQSVDNDIINNLVPVIQESMKTSIGMPTKVGCGRVLITLFTGHTQAIRPFASEFLKLMKGQTYDANDEVSKGYARASAYIIRVAADDAQQQFLESCTEQYFSGGDEARRQKTADVMVALAKISPDHFCRLENITLPFSYFAAHDVDNYTRKGFEEVWSQHAGSGRTVLRFADEICSLAGRSLDTTQWSFRHTAGFTMAAMVQDAARASDSTRQIPILAAKAIWPVLNKALALKTFPGKEIVLDAFPVFVEKSQAIWSGDNSVSAQMKHIAVREAKRNNPEYRVHAFRNLWKFVKARGDVDMLDEIVNIVSPHLGDFCDDGKMDVDSKQDVSSRTASNGLEALVRSYDYRKMAEAPVDILKRAFSLAIPFIDNVRFSWIKRTVWYDCVKDLMEEAHVVSDKAGEDEVAVSFLESLDPEKSDTGTEAQRIARARAIGAILKAVMRGVFGPLMKLDQMRNVVNRAMAGERSGDVQKLLKSALAVLPSSGEE